jgi:hypothetical protein
LGDCAAGTQKKQRNAEPTPTHDETLCTKSGGRKTVCGFARKAATIKDCSDYCYDWGVNKASWCDELEAARAA